MNIDLENIVNKQLIVSGADIINLQTPHLQFELSITDKKVVTKVADDLKVFLLKFPSSQLKWQRFWIVDYKDKIVFITPNENLELDKLTKRNFSDLESFIDNFLDIHNTVFENICRKLENVEQKVLYHTLIKVSDLHVPKRNLISQRRSLKVLQEIIQDNFDKKESKLTRIYELVSNIDLQREISDELLNLIISVSSQKTNDVMRVLTVISTIFMPLTFLVGVYGMNFKNLPELDWAYGYYYIWGFMITITAIMIYFFKKKNWI